MGVHANSKKFISNLLQNLAMAMYCTEHFLRNCWYMVSGQISSEMPRREFSIFITFPDAYTCTYVV